MYEDIKCVKDVESYICKDINGLNRFKHPEYKRIFNRNNGFMARMGKNTEDDPQYAPMPEILDLEISIHGCRGSGKGPCKFCYKGNTSEPATNMSFETFKSIFDKMKANLDSVAFGITGVQTNPDFVKMMKYCRDNKVVPNFTLSGFDLTDELAKEIAKYVGGLAVSVYDTDKNVCYNTVKKFIDLGIEQSNIHALVSQETLPFIYEVIEDIKTDSRLKKLNAIIFLGLKPKGRAKDKFHVVKQDEYTKLINYCFKNDIKFGFDSCSAYKFETAIRENKNMEDDQKEELLSMSESCESSLFSAYVDVYGKFWPCSFCENVESIIPIDVLTASDFYKDVWMHPETIKFRNKLLGTTENNCRKCPVYNLD